MKTKIILVIIIVVETVTIFFLSSFFLENKIALLNSNDAVKRQEVIISFQEQQIKRLESKPTEEFYKINEGPRKLFQPPIVLQSARTK